MLLPPQNGETALMFAAKSGHKEAARLILDKGSSKPRAADDVSPDINLTRLSGFKLGARRRSSMVLLALSRLHECAQKGRTALMLAAQRSNSAMVGLLLDCGADPRAQDMVRLVALSAKRAITVARTRSLQRSVLSFAGVAKFEQLPRGHCRAL